MTIDPIEGVLHEHFDEATFLWTQRANAVEQPNYAPDQFASLDERLEAHIDGLRVAGQDGWDVAEAALDNAGPEDFFPASVLAVEAPDDRWSRIVVRTEAEPDAVPGVISAFGWVDPKFLTGRVKSLLDDSSSFRQFLGLAACAVHRKDPGPLLERFLTAPGARPRSRAIRTAGELGRVDLLKPILRALADDKEDLRYWACRSGVLLGDRGKALGELTARAVKPGVRQLSALQLALQAMEMDRCHELLEQLPDVLDTARLRIIGAGFTGAIRYVPWLIEQMTLPTVARVAGEAFVNLTGADFNLDQLEAMPPDEFEEGPTDDPADENVEVPEDVALQWPDAARIKAWWQRNGPRFADSTRYFLGSPISRNACINVLKTGFQRQRILAAQHLCLLDPGAPLFSTSAPGWRQQRLLAKMT